MYFNNESVSCCHNHYQIQICIPTCIMICMFDCLSFLLGLLSIQYSVSDDQIWKNFVFNEEMTSKMQRSCRLRHR